MKKIRHIFAAVLSFLMFSTFVSASKCNYTELAEINKEAAGVKISYEEKKVLLEGDNGVSDIDGEDENVNEEDVYEYYFTVNIINVTDDLYIKVINPNDNSIKILTSADAVDGVISFDWHDLDTITNLTVKIYSSSKTNCADEEILSTAKTLPMYNVYSTTPYCEENPEDKICQRYVTSEVTDEQYQAKAEKYVKASVDKANSENESAVKKVTKFVGKNKKGFIIGGSIIIVVGVVTTVVVINKRRSRLI